MRLGQWRCWTRNPPRQHALQPHQQLEHRSVFLLTRLKEYGQVSISTPVIRAVRMAPLYSSLAFAKGSR